MVLPVRVVWLAILFLAVSVARAESIQARVVGVTDGDTVTVLTADKRQMKVRLAGIDAPEKGQPFGQKSKQNLSDLVMGELVTVEWSKRDRYGRIVGKVFTEKGADACLGQIKAGLAWWYEKYANEQSDEDQRVYEKAEAAARAAQVGLWSDPNPIAPWDWRKKK